jgi:hypothetical protein
VRSLDTVYRCTKRELEVTRQLEASALAEIQSIEVLYPAPDDDWGEEFGVAHVHVLDEALSFPL